MSTAVELTRGLLVREQQEVIASGKVRIIWDRTVKGFAARVQPSGISFLLDYRHGKVQRRMVFGRIQLLSVTAARRKAASLKLQVLAGEDPLTEVRAKRKAAEQQVTMAEVVEQWKTASRATWSGHTLKTYTNMLAKDVLPD